VDVTALDVMDSFAVRTLRDIAHMARLRGAETVIVGIQPDVAFRHVQLGLTLKGVATVLDLEEGLAFLNRRTEERFLETKPRRPSDRGEELRLPIAADVDVVEARHKAARLAAVAGFFQRRADGDRAAISEIAATS